jgi:hypothetical protein
MPPPDRSKATQFSLWRLISVGYLLSMPAMTSLKPWLSISRDAILFWAVALLLAGAILSSASTHATEGATAEAHSTDACHQRFEQFIARLDAVLQTAKSWNDLQAPLRTLSQLEGCSLDEVERISRKSRFFAGVDDQPHARIFRFDTRPNEAYRGTLAIFGLLKSPRRFHLPFAKFKSLS